MGLGIYSPDSIDLVTRNVRMDTWAVVLTETSQWDGSEDQLDRLERKLERYRRFVVDGEMRRLYPESKAKPVSIEIHLYSEPTAAALAVIQHVRNRLVPCDIPVVVQHMGAQRPQSLASGSYGTPSAAGAVARPTSPLNTARASK